MDFACEGDRTNRLSIIVIILIIISIIIIIIIICSIISIILSSNPHVDRGSNPLSLGTPFAPLKVATQLTLDRQLNFPLHVIHYSPIPTAQ